MSEWDRKLPETADDVVALLRRRCEVHDAWRQKLLAGDPKTLESSKLGSGTVESHSVYIRQYIMAIKVIRDLQRAVK